MTEAERPPDPSNPNNSSSKRVPQELLDLVRILGRALSLGEEETGRLLESSVAEDEAMRREESLIDLPEAFERAVCSDASLVFHAAGETFQSTSRTPPDFRL